MILLQAGGSGGGNMSFLILMLGMFGIMYFFMIRPQQKKQKEQKKMVEELRAGEQVVTASGLHGKVLSKTDTTVTISAGGAKLTFDKNAIVRKV